MLSLQAAKTHLNPGNYTRPVVVVMAHSAKPVTARPKPEDPETIGTNGIVSACRHVLSETVLDKPTKANPFGGSAKGLIKVLCAATKEEFEPVQQIVRANSENEAPEHFGDRSGLMIVEWFALMCGDDNVGQSLAVALGNASSLVAPFLKHTGLPVTNYGLLVALVMCAQAQLTGDQLTEFFEYMHQHDGSDKVEAKTMKAAAKAIADARGITVEQALAELAALRDGETAAASKAKPKAADKPAGKANKSESARVVKSAAKPAKSAAKPAARRAAKTTDDDDEEPEAAENPDDGDDE
jgi:hypothetical protein